MFGLRSDAFVKNLKQNIWFFAEFWAKKLTLVNFVFFSSNSFRVFSYLILVRSWSSFSFFNFSFTNLIRKSRKYIGPIYDLQKLFSSWSFFNSSFSSSPSTDLFLLFISTEEEFWVNLSPRPRPYIHGRPPGGRIPCGPLAADIFSEILKCFLFYFRWTFTTKRLSFAASVCQYVTPLWVDTWDLYWERVQRIQIRGVEWRYQNCQNLQVRNLHQSKPRSKKAKLSLLR